MPNLTLSIPAELKQKMDAHKEINWSEVARQAIYEKTILLERMGFFLSRSKVTEADIEEYGASIKRKVFRKHKKK